MKKLFLSAAVIFSLGMANAALKPGDHLSPYTIHNVSTDKEYCQVCAFGAKPGKLVAFGKLGDAAFWSDLEKMQALQTANPKLGVFAQITDSKDAAAVKAEAAKHNITFPVVIPVEKNWNDLYKIDGASRIIYYAQRKNNIVWTATGISATDVATLESQIKKDIGS